MLLRNITLAARWEIVPTMSTTVRNGKEEPKAVIISRTGESVGCLV